MKKSKYKFKQQSFIKPQKKFFGGALLAGKRKSLRPLSSKDSIHFVMRSRWARGTDSFLCKRNRSAVDLIITKFSKKFGVRIYERAINGNHIHLLLKITNRVLYRAFIKAVTGKIASHVMKQQSFELFRESKVSSEWGDGVNMTKKGQGFWEFRPFSRIVNWGRDYQSSVKYLRQNVLEALGFIRYTPRKNYYSAWFAQNIPDF